MKSPADLSPTARRNSWRVNCGSGQYDEARRSAVFVSVPAFSERVNPVVCDGTLIGFGIAHGWHPDCRHVETGNLEAAYADARLWVDANVESYNFALAGPEIVATPK